MNRPELIPIAREDGQIVARMVGTSGKAECPDYFVGKAADAWKRGFDREREKMKARLASIR